ncbi:MAG: hypothetical protein MRERV_57c004 [Mycoplasmataceae bacterium RV_VA103A]|nr:MAG: hypothetical protein MRERV_57c004 [Mycoplasmataceae bacterium RV_VA103A]
MPKVNNNNLITVITQNKEVKTILQELDQELKNSCQKVGCPPTCRQIPTLPQQVLTQLKIMENQADWQDEINDPDFRWAEYKQELQSELIELGEKYPQYLTPLQNLGRDLEKIKHG